MSAPDLISEHDLLYTDVEDDLRSTLRDLLADHCHPEAVTALYDGDRTLVDSLWKMLASELGLAGLLIPEVQGGAGASPREAAVVLEELGRSVAPVPFLTSAVVATTTLLGSDGDLLPELAAGRHTAALLVPLSTAPDGLIPAASAANGHLTGTTRSVAGAMEADTLLVPAISEGRLALFAVAATDATRTPVTSLDMTRQLSDVVVDGAPGTMLVPDAETSIRRGLLAGSALLASEQAGIARWCLDATVEYLLQRRQFGRVVGGFQAIKHRLADLATGVDSATAVARHAAAVLTADESDSRIATAVAQAYCSDFAVNAAEEAVQLHAGIGMTWEYPAHLYLKRAKADQIAFGTAGAHRARLAALVDLPGPS